MTVRADDLLDQLRARQNQQQQSSFAAAASAAPRTKVYFSPSGGCTDAIVRELAAAKSSILIKAYSFTSKAIAEALVAVHRRGVKIEIVLDYSNKTDQYSAADFCAHAGIATFLDGRYKIAHSKVMVIDSATVITGSFNFTRSAENDNKKNLLVIHDPKIAAIYTAEFQRQRTGVEPYRGR